MSIEVNEVTKIYGKQKALNSVSFKVEKGEIVGLLGPNGAGKSTMMKILTCFLPQNSGEAKVCNYDVIEYPLEVRKLVGYLPENNPLYTDMYVKEYLEFICGIHKLGTNSKKRISEIIEITGLTIEQNKKIGSLSKGYKQRVGLAQAMIHNPEVLILDEPTSGLDPNQLLEIRNLIKEFGKDKTILLSTHIMQEVEAVCDKVIIINDGIIIANDKTTNINQIKVGKNLIYIEFEEEVKPELFYKISGVIKVIPISAKQFNIEINSDSDIRSELFQFAVSNHLTVLSMNKVEHGLEEIFRDLTKKK